LYSADRSASLAVECARSYDTFVTDANLGVHHIQLALPPGGEDAEPAVNLKD